MLIVTRRRACVRCGLNAIVDRAGSCKLCQFEQATGRVYIDWSRLEFSARVNDRVQGMRRVGE